LTEARATNVSPNTRPDHWRFHGPALGFALLFTATVVLVVISLLLPDWHAKTDYWAVVFAGVVSFGGFVAFLSVAQGHLWEHAPDTVTFGPDQVTGNFGPHLVVRRVTVTEVMPYAEMKPRAGEPSLVDARMRMPVMSIWAERLEVPGRMSFDTWENLRPPEELQGFASRLDLRADNFDRCLAAKCEWDRRQPPK
jgi:hypothetical protein